MSIKILAQTIPLSTPIQKILTHYFPKNHPPTQPSSANKKTILIDTKYYTCQIPLTIQNFNSNINKQNQQITEKLSEEQEKVDGLIFVFEENQEVIDIRENIQRWVGKWEPEFVVVCVGGKDRGGEWRYQADIADCENFVPVIYEDFQMVSQLLPAWSPNSGLLKQEQREDYQVFNLLQMLQTTSWTNQIPKKSHIAPTPKKPNPNPQSTLTTTTKPPTSSPPQEQQLNQKQPTQQQLQKQMYQFQLLMQQMMQVKAMSTNTVNHNDKKKRAEDVIMRLAKFMGQ